MSEKLAEGNHERAGFYVATRLTHGFQQQADIAQHEFD